MNDNPDAFQRAQPSIERLIGWLNQEQADKQRREKIKNIAQFFGPREVMNPGEEEKAAKINQIGEIPVDMEERARQTSEASIIPPERPSGPMTKAGERPRFPAGVGAPYPRTPKEVGTIGPQATTQRRTLADAPPEEVIGLMGENTRAEPDDIMNMMFGQEAQRAKTAQAFGMEKYKSELDEGEATRLESQKHKGQMELEAIKKKNPSVYQFYLDAAGGDPKEARRQYNADMIERAKASAMNRSYSRAPNLVDMVRKANQSGETGVKGKQELRMWMEANGKKGEVLRTDPDGTVVYGIPAGEDANDDGSTTPYPEVVLERKKPPAGKGDLRSENIRDRAKHIADSTAAANAQPGGKKTVSLSAVRARHSDATETDDELRKFYEDQGYTVTP
jgi:hypothetical protein